MSRQRDRQTGRQTDRQTRETSCRRAAATVCPAPLLPAGCRSAFRPFDFESDVRDACDVCYLCANFGLPMPLCSRLRPDVCKRQTDRR